MISLQIQGWRTIKELEIEFPVNKTVVLFGATYNGKSNILLAIQKALTGSCYFIEGGIEAKPQRLIRWGENRARVNLVMPTFESLYEHNNGKLLQRVKINDKEIDSDRNEEHLAELHKHIGADKIADLTTAIKRFLYINPQSKNIFTIGSTERKAYLLERWDFSKLQNIRTRATQSLNVAKNKIEVLEHKKIEGVETDTTFLRDQISTLENLLKNDIHYSRISELELGYDRLKQKEAQLQAKQLSDEVVFAAEQQPLLEKIKFASAWLKDSDDLVDRSICRDRANELSFKIKTNNSDVYKLNMQLDNALLCKKCGAEHYYNSSSNDIVQFSSTEIKALIAEKQKSTELLQGELNSFNMELQIWQCKDDLANYQKTLEALKQTQEIRRINLAEQLIQIANDLEASRVKLISAKAAEDKFKELEAYKRQFDVAETGNTIVRQAREQQKELEKLNKSREGLDYLVRIGIPEAIHEAVEQPLINLVAEINHALEMMEIDPRVSYLLKRNGDGLPSDIELPILTHGRTETFASINSQGLARMLSFSGLIGELAAFGSPFTNIESLVLFDDPLFGAYDVEEYDTKSRLARAIGKLASGTEIIAIGDEAAVKEMNADIVYRVHLENGETKVNRI